MSKLRKQLEQLREDVARWHADNLRDANESNLAVDRHYCRGKDYEDWLVLQHLDAILAESPAPASPAKGEGKWRDVDDKDNFRVGDRYRTTKKSFWLIVRGITDEPIEMNVGEWKNTIEPIGGQVQRRTPKRPSLKRLVKRLPITHFVEFWGDGTIYERDGADLTYRVKTFKSIDALKDYLSTLPEVDA
jgi:hypothetical protein